MQSLLVNEENIDVISITASDQADLLRNIKQFQPEVVILDDDSDLTNPGGLLANLNDVPQCRLVIVSANEDFVKVFEQRQVFVRKASKLADLIRCEPGCP
jgi:chemotaxis response regulator CheB